MQVRHLQYSKVLRNEKLLDMLCKQVVALSRLRRHKNFFY